MKIIDKFIFYLIMIGAMFVIVQTSYRVEKVARGTLYDPDLARKQCVEEVKYQAISACIYGTDYPPEFREAVGFNPRSPMIFCNKYYGEKEDYIINAVGPLGRKEEQ